MCDMIKKNVNDQLSFFFTVVLLNLIYSKHIFREWKQFAGILVSNLFSSFPKSYALSEFKKRTG